MPCIDLPLAQLRTYQGRNPRPDDFDAYWDRALVEMRAVDARVELRPAAFQAPGAECFDLWFTGVGGARVHAKYLRPAGRVGRCPAVVLFHGYTGSSGDWFPKLAWVAMGFCVAALDCRGQGGQSQDVGGALGNTHHGHIVRGLGDPDPHALLYRAIFLDTAQLAGLVMAMPEVDPARVSAHGGSQGGALTIACAALEPRIARAAPVFPFLCDYRRVWEMDLAKDAYRELREWFRHYDPRHEREDEVFTRLGYIDIQFLAPRVRAEVLMGVGLMDAICPPSTQYACFNKLSTAKEAVIYPDFGHEDLPGFPDRVARFIAAI
jgi:cephalosporin-C deacetylase